VKYSKEYVLGGDGVGVGDGDVGGRWWIWMWGGVKGRGITSTNILLKQESR